MVSASMFSSMPAFSGAFWRSYISIGGVFDYCILSCITPLFPLGLDMGILTGNKPRSRAGD